MKQSESSCISNAEGHASNFSRVMLSEEYLTMSVSKSTPGSRRVTPSKTLPTEVRTPNSRKLKHFGGTVPRISVDTVHQVLTTEIKCNFLLIDCRYTYEFAGGHIVGALNCPPSDKLVLMDWLFSSEHGIVRKGPLVLIMHCEFSQCRAPRIATDVLRQYIGLGLKTGLEVYVMKGGYSEFFRKFPEWCDPIGYTPMHDHRQSEGGLSSCSVQPQEFDPEMFLERRSLSSNKVKSRAYESSGIYSMDSPFFNATGSPMDYSPMGVVADLARAFIEEEMTGDDSNSGSSGAASLRTVGNILTEEDDGYSSSDDGHSLLFKRQLCEEHSSPSRSSSSSSLFIPPKRRASMSERMTGYSIQFN